MSAPCILVSSNAEESEAQDEPAGENPQPRGWRHVTETTRQARGTGGEKSFCAEVPVRRSGTPSLSLTSFCCVDLAATSSQRSPAGTCSFQLSVKKVTTQFYGFSRAEKRQVEQSNRGISSCGVGGALHGIKDGAFAMNARQTYLARDILNVERPRQVVLAIDVPLVKKPSMETAQHRPFLVFNIGLYATVVISEVLPLSTKSRCSRCRMAHLWCLQKRMHFIWTPLDRSLGLTI